MTSSALEDTFHLLLLAHNYPDPRREFVLVPGRRFRADFAWPDKMLAVEIEGGIWTGGRHVTGSGYTADCRKYNLAQLSGWTVLRFTAEMLNSGEAMEMLEKAWNYSELYPGGNT